MTMTTMPDTTLTSAELRLAARILRQVARYVRAEDTHAKRGARDPLSTSRDDADMQSARLLDFDPRDCSALANRLLSLARAGLEAGKAEEWLPIETAPTNGTRVLALCADAQAPRASITWWDGRWLVQVVPDKFVSGDPRQWFPTHWRPLPAPPAIRALPLTGGDKP